jgi:hypothetical protein
LIWLQLTAVAVRPVGMEGAVLSPLSVVDVVDDVEVLVVGGLVLLVVDEVVFEVVVVLEVVEVVVVGLAARAGAGTPANATRAIRIRTYPGDPFGLLGSG